MHLVGNGLGRISLAVDNGEAVAVGRAPMGNAEADSRSPTCDNGDAAHRLA
jgi:hypothetical protein